MVGLLIQIRLLLLDLGKKSKPVKLRSINLNQILTYSVIKQIKQILKMDVEKLLWNFFSIKIQDKENSCECHT